MRQGIHYIYVENSCGSTKKIVKQFRLSKRGGKGAFSLAAERMCPAFRVY